jgi:hypothetical protein
MYYFKKTKSVRTMKSNSKNGELLCNDMYDKITLIKRFTNFINMYISDNELINNGLNIRHQNTREDISENIYK